MNDTSVAPEDLLVAQEALAQMQEKLTQVCWQRRLKCIAHVCVTAPDCSDFHDFGIVFYLVVMPDDTVLLGQLLNFKLFGITYLVGKISRSNFYFRVQDG